MRGSVIDQAPSQRTMSHANSCVPHQAVCSHQSELRSYTSKYYSQGELHVLCRLLWPQEAQASLVQFPADALRNNYYLVRVWFPDLLSAQTEAYRQEPQMTHDGDISFENVFSEDMSWLTCQHDGSGEGRRITSRGGRLCAVQSGG